MFGITIIHFDLVPYREQKMFCNVCGCAICVYVCVRWEKKMPDSSYLKFNKNDKKSENVKVICILFSRHGKNVRYKWKNLIYLSYNMHHTLFIYLFALCYLQFFCFFSIILFYGCKQDFYGWKWFALIVNSYLWTMNVLMTSVTGFWWI